MTEPKGFLVVPIGFRADGTLRALELTDSDELKIALATAAGSDLLTELQAKLETADLELVSKILSSGPHGWVGGAWQRQPIDIGYSASVHRRWGTNDLPAGSSFQDDAAVPAGEIWQITFFTFQYYGTSPTHVDYIMNSSGSDYYLHTQLSPASDSFYALAAELTMEEDDYLRLRIVGATLNDNIIGVGLGRRIDIDQ